MSTGRTGLRREAVPSAFDRAASAYDQLVAANPGYHQDLRRSALRMRLPWPGIGLRLLDVGCGTGASTAALLRVLPKADITAIDASADMLARARAKRWPDSVRFVHTEAERLGASGVRGPFHGIFAAYLVRNLAEPDSVLRSLAGMLHPGGAMALHEYSVRDSIRARAVWHAVCLGIIIPAGRFTSGDATLYHHLWRSVTAFDDLETLRGRLRHAGLQDIRTATMPGWRRGVVHTVSATAADAVGAG